MNTKVKPVAAAKSVPATEYRTRFTVPDEYDEANGDRTSVEVSKGNSTFRINFESVQDEFCCGVYSVGRFGISDSAAIPPAKKVEVTKQLFSRFIDIMKRDSEEITLMLTLIDNPACNMVKKALADGELFTKVKTFKNLNSGRVNELYISN